VNDELDETDEEGSVREVNSSVVGEERIADFTRIGTLIMYVVSFTSTS